MSAIQQYTDGLRCEVIENASMRDFTTFKIGGNADAVIQVGDADSMHTLLSRLSADNIPYLLIGSGSNLLIADEGIHGVVIRFDNRLAQIEQLDETTLRVDAGVQLAKLSRTAQQKGLSGMEFACGIPGSTGGGLYMNAGAYGGDMSQIVKSAEILMPDGEIRTVDAEELELSYRHSALMTNGGVALRVTVSLTKGDTEAIRQTVTDLLTARREKQPLEYPSAGSFFKRPTGYFAGKLIDDCGLRGYRVGDAQVSEKHAGFVINRGNATCEQVKQLEKDVRTRVFEQFGVTMSPEVRLLGTAWMA